MGLPQSAHGWVRQTQKHNVQYAALAGIDVKLEGCGSSEGTRLILDGDDWEGFPERGHLS